MEGWKGGIGWRRAEENKKHTKQQMLGTLRCWFQLSEKCAVGFKVTDFLDVASPSCFPVGSGTSVCFWLEMVDRKEASLTGGWTAMA